jgi:hypothetical protein
MRGSGTSITVLKEKEESKVCVAVGTPIINADMTNNIIVELILFVFSHQFWYTMKLT